MDFIECLDRVNKLVDIVYNLKRFIPSLPIHLSLYSIFLAGYFKLYLTHTYSMVLLEAIW